MTTTYNDEICIWGCDKEKTIAYIKCAFKQCHSKVASSEVPLGFKD